MARPWAEVAADPNFQALAPDAQESARNAYFQQNVLPNIPAGTNSGAIRIKFDQDTIPTLKTVQATPGLLTQGINALRDSALGGVVETAGQGLTNLAGKIAGGFAGIGTGLTNAAGLTNTPAASVEQSVENALTYQPRGAGAQQLQGWMQKGAELAQTPTPLTRAVDVGVQSLPPQGQAAAETVIGALPETVSSIGGVLGAEAPLGTAVRGMRGMATDALAARAAAREAAAHAPPSAGAGAYTPAPELQALAQEGYSARPSDIQARNPALQVPGGLQERVAGPANEQILHTANNQVQTTRLGGQVLGKTNATRITLADVERANRAPSSVYNATGEKLGMFKASPEYTTALEDIATDPTAPKPGLGLIRRQAAEGTLDGTDLVEQISEARVKGADALSKAMEDEIERQLSSRGADGAQALADYRAARVQFAQNYLVRDALRGGQVDAQFIARRSRQIPGVMTGPLATIASAGDLLPEVTRLPKPGSGPPIGMNLGDITQLPGTLVSAGLRKVVPKPSQAKLFGAPTPLPQSSPQIQAMIDAARRKAESGANPYAQTGVP